MVGNCGSCPLAVALAPNVNLPLVELFVEENRCHWRTRVDPFRVVNRATDVLVWLLGGVVKISVSTPPFALMESITPLGDRGLFTINGWALGANLSTELHGPTGGMSSAELSASRADVESQLPGWKPAFGFSHIFHEAELPSGRIALRLTFTNSQGRSSLFVPFESKRLLGAALIDHTKGHFANVKEVGVQVWITNEDGPLEVYAKTEPIELQLGPLQDRARNVSLGDVIFADPQVAHRGGNVYDALLDVRLLPRGISRIVICARSSKLRQNCWPGPIIQAMSATPLMCFFPPLKVYLPGDSSVVRDHFPLLHALRSLFHSLCTQIGVRMRVEYLRSTFGVNRGYEFDPDFRAALNDSIRVRLTGVIFSEAVRNLRLGNSTPVLWTLDGGVWADSSFSWPEYDVVDNLEQDLTTCQWNQRDEVPSDDALRDLSGSISAPQLARMMSLNFYNTRYRTIKRRNLQAAVRAVLEAGLDSYISLDPDNYVNPWFAHQQWFDYNPDTLKQYQEWRDHTGLYNATGALAGRGCRKLFPPHKEEINAPRGRPDYSSPWHQLWTEFKRHLVKQHYEDLANWAHEAGIPSDRIYTSQGIEGGISIDADEPAHDWADVAGVFLGAGKPTNGHLGVLFYGPTSRNRVSLLSGHSSLFEAITRLDADWGVVETNPTSLHSPFVYATHQDSYETLFHIINFGASFVSPMVGGSRQEVDGSWRRTRAYDMLLGTPFEYQFCWWVLEWRTLGKGCHHFPFGNAFVPSYDGWRVENKTATARNGELFVDTPPGTHLMLHLPSWLPSLLPTTHCVVVRGQQISSLSVSPKSISLVALGSVTLDSISYLPGKCTEEVLLLFDVHERRLLSYDVETL